ncbi:MAG: DinB family protein, partial [Sphingobacteriales bacterium]
AQLAYLKRESQPGEKDPLTGMDEQILLAIEQLKTTNTETLTDFRGVGRKQLPSTVIGLLMHAAEHTMRHTGQLIVTARWLKDAASVS